MKLGALVLRLRTHIDDRGDEAYIQAKVGGAAEYAYAREGTLNDEMFFILPLQESANTNEYDNSINQILIEQFAVVVAVKNDTDYKDKTGFYAYNRLHDIREEVFGAFLGCDLAQIDSESSYTTESIIYYRGGQLLDFNRGYLFYQFTFEYKVGLQTKALEDEPDGYLDTIFAQYEISPSENLPYSEDLPVPEAAFAPDMEQLVDLADEAEELTRPKFPYTLPFIFKE